MLDINFFKIPKRFQLLKTFAITFITLSFIVRILLYFLSLNTSIFLFEPFQSFWNWFLL